MNNTLIHNDVFNIFPSLSDNSIDLVITDPPYLVNYNTNRRKDKGHTFCKPIDNDNQSIDFIKHYIDECYRILKPNHAMYMFSSQTNIDLFKQALEDKFNIKNLIVWVKNNWTAGDLEAAYGRQYEFIFLCNKGRSIMNGKRYSDVWEFDRVVGNCQEHQNQKPVTLLQRMIAAHSLPGDLIFDGFMGSGSTCLAAYSLNRFYYGVEINKEHYESAVNLLNDNQLLGGYYEILK